MKIGAVVQVRMGSTRLPGKVIKEIAGKPVLLHVIDRLKKAELLDQIIIATTNLPQDDVIVNLVNEYGVKVYRGEEHDVLDRYYQAAKENMLDVVVRITSDCPLIDPEVIDVVIRAYIDRHGTVHYVSNTLQRTYPRGLDVEVFFFSTLQKAWQEGKNLHYREHVTPYIYENPERFNLLNVSCKKNLSHLRWTLDTQEDLEFIEEIYQRLYRPGKIFLMKEILQVLEKEPTLIEINKNVEQKPLK